MRVVQNALQEKRTLKLYSLFLKSSYYVCISANVKKLIVSSNAKRRPALENEARRRAHQSLVFSLCIFYRYDHP